MSENMTSKKFANNVVLSLLAQLISILTSFVLNFLVPKFIPELQYSYWQTYVLYVSYVGVLHFGLLDGIVLRYSQYDYENIDKVRVRSQFQLMLLFTTACCIGTCLIATILTQGISWIIFVLVSAGMITKNAFTYTSYTYQITNRIKYYAFLVITQKIAYAFLVGILLFLKVSDFYWYCIADLFGDMVGFVIGTYHNKGLYFGKSLSLKEVFKEAGTNISCGIMLMIANFSSSLLLGGAKMVIQWQWDTLKFGKVAFAFSVSNLFLTFVTAISVVLFPSLKRMQEDELPSLYGKIRNAVSPLLFVAMLLYFPLNKVLVVWLPKYTTSLVYLGILLPVIIFSSKVSLLTNNYLKAYRKEKLMLMLYLISVVFGIVLFLLCAYGFNNLNLLLCSVVFVIMVRSIASEIAVSMLIHQKFYIEFAMELLMTVGFIISVQLFRLWIGCAVYAAMLVVYLAVNWKNLAQMLHAANSMFHKKEKQQ